MEHRRMIKQGNIVFATQEDGSVESSGVASQGLFVADTRFLSRFHLYLDGVKPRLMGSSEEKLYQAGYLHANPALDGAPARSVGIVQRNVIEDGAARIEITLANMSTHPVSFELSVELDADFYDSFETRGVKRAKRGETSQCVSTPNSLLFQYMGLDGAKRTTRVDVTPTMERYENGRMVFPISLAANLREVIVIKVNCETESPAGAAKVYEPIRSRALQPEWFDKATTVEIGNPLVHRILRRSIEDLRMLMIEFPDLWAPAAGLPRFAVPFGRDSIFTSLMTLSWNPCIAHDVLRFLARVQGKEENPYTYEQPGKILHEMHTGELARLKEIPFGLFYGSVDSTVLFLMLAAEYIVWTGDIALYLELKPNLDAAWKWVDEYGNIDGSGYVQYKAHTAPKMASAALTVGLFNQGWKDSANALSYSDGTLCEDHPVALAEVQGYLYRALVLWGTIYGTLPQEAGMARESEKLLARAAQLKERFNREFWMPEREYYAIALDGQHRQVDTITSNPGHCLWTGLIAEDHAGEVARTLLSKSMSSSWGIRSMANTEKQYNAISYHNGSVWPFENALIGAGLRRYGYTQEADAVFDAVIDATEYFEYRRWPEVYSGVAKDLVNVLGVQPDASRPQAWSAASIFLWIQSWLGIAPRAFSREIDLTPALPAGVEQLSVRNMVIGRSVLSVTVYRHNGSTQLQIDDNPDNLRVTLQPLGARIADDGATSEPQRELAEALR